MIDINFRAISVKNCNAAKCDYLNWKCEATQKTTQPRHRKHAKALGPSRAEKSLAGWEIKNSNHLVDEDINLKGLVVYGREFREELKRIADAILSTGQFSGQKNSSSFRKFCGNQKRGNICGKEQNFGST